VVHRPPRPPTTTSIVCPRFAPERPTGTKSTPVTPGRTRTSAPKPPDAKSPSRESRSEAPAQPVSSLASWYRVLFWGTRTRASVMNVRGGMFSASVPGSYYSEWKPRNDTAPPRQPPTPPKAQGAGVVGAFPSTSIWPFTMGMGAVLRRDWPGLWHLVLDPRPRTGRVGVVRRHGRGPSRRITLIERSARRRPRLSSRDVQALEKF